MSCLYCDSELTQAFEIRRYTDPHYADRTYHRQHSDPALPTWNEEPLVGHACCVAHGKAYMREAGEDRPFLRMLLTNPFLPEAWELRPQELVEAYG